MERITNWYNIEKLRYGKTGIKAEICQWIEIDKKSQILNGDETVTSVTGNGLEESKYFIASITIPSDSGANKAWEPVIKWPG